MADTVITNIQTALNTAVTSTATLCTVDSAGDPEIFAITPTKDKFIIELAETAGVGTITFSIAVGTQFNKAAAALTGSVLASTSKVIEVDTAKYEGALGAISLTVTPTAATKLKTGNVATVKVVQLV